MITDPDFEEFSQQQIQTFVIAAHANLDKVKTMLDAHPGLLNTEYRLWKETALGAASHVGRDDIARFLLDRGAPLTLPAAAMLGRLNDVLNFLLVNPGAANATGAHDISVLYHACLSGNVELVQTLRDHGNTQDLGVALHAAVSKRHPKLVQWLLDHGADPNVPNFADKTPLTVAREIGDTTLVAILIRAHAAE